MDYNRAKGLWNESREKKELLGSLTLRIEAPQIRGQDLQDQSLVLVPFFGVDINVDMVCQP